MNGVVAIVNTRIGRIAIKTECEGFTIIELDDSSAAEIGDEVKWDPTCDGRMKLFINSTQKRTFHAEQLHCKVASADVLQTLGNA